MLNLHILNSKALKGDISQVIETAKGLMEGDPFCGEATNIVLGDFNNQLLQRSTYSNVW